MSTCSDEMCHIALRFRQNHLCSLNPFWRSKNGLHGYNIIWPNI